MKPLSYALLISALSFTVTAIPLPARVLTPSSPQDSSNIRIEPAPAPKVSPAQTAGAPSQPGVSLVNRLGKIFRYFNKPLAGKSSSSKTSNTKMDSSLNYALESYDANDPKPLTPITTNPSEKFVGTRIRKMLEGLWVSGGQPEHRVLLVDVKGKMIAKTESSTLFVYLKDKQDPNALARRYRVDLVSTTEGFLKAEILLGTFNVKKRSGMKNAVWYLSTDQ